MSQKDHDERACALFAAAKAKAQAGGGNWDILDEMKDVIAEAGGGEVIGARLGLPQGAFWTEFATVAKAGYVNDAVACLAEAEQMAARGYDNNGELEEFENKRQQAGGWEPVAAKLDMDIETLKAVVTDIAGRGAVNAVWNWVLQGREDIATLEKEVLSERQIKATRARYLEKAIRPAIERGGGEESMARRFGIALPQFKEAMVTLAPLLLACPGRPLRQNMFAGSKRRSIPE